MALRINTNVTALVAHRNLVTNDSKLSGSIEKLSSGLRINRAADDAAGLTISEKLRTQVKGITRAIQNVQDGISMIQTAEGGLNEVHSMLQRMRELAIQASNDTLTSTDRLEIQKEIQQLKEDINRISYGTEFNTKRLLDGSCTANVSCSDPSNLEGVATGEVATFSDFSIVVNPKVITLPSGQQQVMRGSPQINRSAIFVRSDGVVASSSTTLQSITNFYDKNGNFLLELPQTLYLQGDNHQGTLQVSKDITLAQLAQRMQDAMNTDQLGNGLNFEGSTVTFSPSGETNGQITTTSGKMGNIGRINVTGEEDLVKALGFQQVVAPEDPVYVVESTNLGVPATSRTTNSTQVAGARAAGLIKGIDLVFQPPAAAFVDTKKPDMGISIPSDITFDIDDSVPGGTTGPVTVTIPQGNWSMPQVVSIVNDQLSIVGPPTTGPGVRVQLNDANALNFYSTNTGSAAWVNISATSVANNVLGIADGRYYGTGGYSGAANATGALVSYQFPTGINFDITDSHGNAVNVDLGAGGPLDYSAGGVTSLVDALNITLAATPLAIRAYENNGMVQLRSTETGVQSNFTVQNAEELNVLNQTTISGYDGQAASQTFLYDQTSTKWGYVVADDGAGANDDLVFFVADLNGKGTQISISAGDTANGNTFKSTMDIINAINTACDTNQIQVNAELNPDNSIKLYSKITGKEGVVTLAEQGAIGSINNLSTVMNLSAKSYTNGIGNTEFKMHVRDAFVMFQVGPNEGHFAKANMIRCDTIALGVNDLDLTNVRDAQKAITLLDHAIQYVSSERAKLGAVENRMTYTNNSLSVALSNMSASESRIRDVDMAAEVVEMTKFQILQQASNAMVAQANTSSQRVLELLR